MSVLTSQPLEPRLGAMVNLIASLPQLADPREALPELLQTMRPGIGRRAVARVSTGGLSGGECCILDVQPVNPREGAGLAAPIILPGSSVLSTLLRTPAPKLVHHLPPGGGGVPAQLALYQSLVAAPLFVDGMARDWVLLFDSRPEAFGVEDLEELLLRTALVSSALNNLRVTQQLCQANLKVHQEIEQIANLQRALLPSELPDIPGLEVAAMYSPTLDAGGDMYDFLPLSAHAPSADAPWAILIADVAGHGPAAAVVMAMMHSILHAHPTPPTGPGQLLAHLNHHLCAKQIGRAFVTAFLAFYHPSTRRFTYARAGHNPPLLHTPETERILSLDAVGDMPLGISTDCVFEEATVELHPGQTLLMYTDGLPESPNAQGHFFEMRGLERALRLSTSPQHLIDLLQSDLSRHQGDCPQVDDQTVVALRVSSQEK